jgi:hypothetical protein
VLVEFLLSSLLLSIARPAGSRDHRFKSSPDALPLDRYCLVAESAVQQAYELAMSR